MHALVCQCFFQPASHGHLFYLAPLPVLLVLAVLCFTRLRALLMSERIALRFLCLERQLSYSVS